MKVGDKYYVYVLKSLENNIYYIGQTKDLMKRLGLHNSNQARWTKRYQPWQIVHSEIYDTRSEAMQREKFLKTKKDISRFLGILK